MYVNCPEEGCYVDLQEDECEECRNVDCKNSLCNDPKAERAKRIKSSEFVLKLKSQVQQHFSLNEEEASVYLDDLVKAIEQTRTAELKLLADEITRHAVQRFIGAKLNKFISDEFDKALEAKVFAFTGEEGLQTTIKKIAMETIKKRVDSKVKGRGNRSASSLDEAVSRLVQKRVDTACDELIRETRTKFEKETMKKMMQGMAKAIGADKKLLMMMSE